MTGPVTQEWLTPEEVAQRAKCSMSRVRKALAQGSLVSYQSEPNGLRRVRIEDADAWIMGGDSGSEDEK